ncbi:uncharacterized protein LOC112168364 isoform X2 [Rosa chinensis]|uniref:uncharacterized protein LOC112168364 isoform X2 n=1 Tax=Rosa chinensis TaxID=74649 RepID=UPI000D094D3D|nr:uncharacterized protein LOC112168364 isoform X2 [Rosa chinensis]
MAEGNEQRDRLPQYRASLQSFNEKMKTYRKVISPDAIMMLTSSPFWDIIKVFHLQFLEDSECKKVDEDILRMVMAYDTKKQGFVLDQTIHKITAEDVATCLGVRLQGVAFPLNKHHQKPKNNGIIDKYFADAKKVTKVMVDNALKEALKDPKKQVPIDVASLIVMNLFISFLFCTSGYTLSWKLVEVCTDWTSWRQYSWASLILDHLHNGLSKKQQEKDVALSGCLPLIMYWLADKTNIGGVIKRHERATPTFIKWSLVELHKEMVKLTNVQIEEMFDQKVTVEDLAVTLHIIKGRNKGAAEAESSETKTVHVFDKNDSACGFTSLIPLRMLNDQQKGYLVDDTCVIEATVAVPKAEMTALVNENGSSAPVQPLGAELPMIAEPLDSRAESPVVKEEPFLSSLPSDETADFRGFGKVDKAFVPLLEEVCSLYPSLVECQQNRGEQFTQWAFTTLGRLLYFLKTRKPKDITEETCRELRKLWAELEVFRFDLSWLKTDFETSLRMKNHVERARQMREEMNALDAQRKRLKAELASVEVNFEEAQRKVADAEELLECELGYGRGEPSS